MQQGTADFKITESNEDETGSNYSAIDMNLNQ